jgi:hypothetical protein
VSTTKLIMTSLALADAFAAAVNKRKVGIRLITGMSGARMSICRRPRPSSRREL